MHTSAHDVAHELRRRLRDPGVVKVHKLLYYCQGWHLAWTGEALFKERIEAWANGPVVADVWADEKHSRPVPPPAPVPDAALATIDYVLDRYGRFSGRDLVRMTHGEAPWRDLGESDEPWDDGEITHEALKAWFDADDDKVRHDDEVARLRRRRDVYSFEAVAPSPRAADLVARFLEDGREQRSDVG